MIRVTESARWLRQMAAGEHVLYRLPDSDTPFWGANHPEAIQIAQPTDFAPLGVLAEAPNDQEFTIEVTL